MKCEDDILHMTFDTWLLVVSVQYTIKYGL